MKNRDFKIRQDEEFIKLGQLLKVCNVVGSGAEAKMRILNGDIRVNGIIEKQRGKKLKDGDIVETDDIKINIIK